jgi:hypothetical protein
MITFQIIARSAITRVIHVIGMVVLLVMEIDFLKTLFADHLHLLLSVIP